MTSHLRTLTTANTSTGPVLLSAASLTLYSILHNGLSASVAFTTIAVLAQIEATLSILPEIITNAIDAFVSLGRIEKFVNAPELVDNRKENEEIAISGAEIAWPSDNPEVVSEIFTLKNVDLTFPKKELSVISGKTGTGKTLLLNALLGEIELLKGSINMPKAPPLSERFDSRANKSTWIIDEAVAYVPQIPWIENAVCKMIYHTVSKLISPRQSRKTSYSVSRMTLVDTRRL